MVFETLWGLITGCAMTATGAGINAYNRRKKQKAYEAEQQDRHIALLTRAQMARDAEDAERAAFRVELESWIGGPLEADQRRKRYYNLPREYELAIQRLDVMFEQFKREHPPGSSVRYYDRKYECSYDQVLRRAVGNYVLKNIDEVLPYTPTLYDDYIQKAFWRRSLATFRGPDNLGKDHRIVTFHVDPGTYAVGEARKQIIREGFLPSNCRDHLWIDWSPYVRWLGHEWNEEFHSCVDIMPSFALMWYSPAIPHPKTDQHFAYDNQRNYEKQHPEHFHTGGNE